jgi:hypothetical protein
LELEGNSFVADPSEPKRDPKRVANQFGSAFPPDNPEVDYFVGPGETEGAGGGGFAPSERKPEPMPADSEFELQIGSRKIRKKTGGGGKLSRSETVTVRLDPKLRYLAELAARKQRRTLSSFIEWAIEENLKSIYLEDGAETRSIASQSADLWDVDEPDRFAKLAIRYPQMLTHDEQVLWKLVKENGCFWRTFSDGTWDIEERDLIFEHLREHWSNLKKVARGELPKSTLPKWENPF